MYTSLFTQTSPGPRYASKRLVVIIIHQTVIYKENVHLFHMAFVQANDASDVSTIKPVR